MDLRILGSIPAKYDPNDEPNEERTNEFHFYDTLIEVVTYKTKTPNVEQSGYIVNYQ